MRADRAALGEVAVEALDNGTCGLGHGEPDGRQWVMRRDGS